MLRGAMLDRTEQRIVGVLIEKEITVPDIYPMSENALVDGCNQKNNRDPVMDLQGFQIAGALMALQEKGWVARIDGGSRVTKYRHKVVDRLALDRREIAVICELLVRGAQSPNALKPRTGRLGFEATPEQIEAVLRQLASRKPALVEQMAILPREQHRRWRHLLGDGSELVPVAPAAAAPAAVPAPGAARDTGAAVDLADLAARVRELEREVEALQRELASLRRGATGD
jgi:uncharacterized protein YceH (UPF0502 family)